MRLLVNLCLTFALVELAYWLIRWDGPSVVYWGLFTVLVLFLRWVVSCNPD